MSFLVMCLFAFFIMEVLKKQLDTDYAKAKFSFIYFLTPVLFCSSLLFLLLFLNLEIISFATFNGYFNFLVGLTIYYFILSLVINKIRKSYATAVINYLWIVPLFSTLFGLEPDPNMAIILKVNLNIVSVVALIWLVGFMICFAYHIVSHIIFRKKILKDSNIISDNHIVNIYNEIASELKMNYTPKLVVSDKIHAPLSIGLFKYTIVVILPSIDYSDDEFRFIFKHELTHIIRNDSKAKFFIAFCNSLCWFNPLIHWISNKNSDDLELSCDEFVLRDASDEKRQAYFNLLLKQAATSKGFTTCLSAKAKSLKYRMQNSLHQTNKSYNTLIVAIMFLLFYVVTPNTIFVNHEPVHPLKNLQNVESVTHIVDNPNSVKLSNYRFSETLENEKIIDYLENLELYEITNTIIHSQEGDFKVSVDNYYIGLNSKYLSLRVYKDSSQKMDEVLYEVYYYIEGGADLDLFQSFATYKNL